MKQKYNKKIATIFFSKFPDFGVINFEQFYNYAKDELYFSTL